MQKVSKETINSLIEKSNKDDVKVVKIGEIDGEDIEIEVKKSLTVDEIYSICSALSTPPFAATDDDTLAYIPSGEVSTFKVAMIRAFMPGLELPDDVMEAYKICADLNLFQTLHNVLKYTDLYHDLNKIAERYSEYHRLSNSGIASVISFINKSLSKINVDEILAKLAESDVDVPGIVSEVVSNFTGNGEVAEAASNVKFLKAKRNV